MGTGRRTSATLDMLLMSLLATNGEMSGYQIANLLREPVPLIWPVKHSQIYPALANLEQGGDVRGRWIDQQGRPNKKAYALSEKGVERLTQWLREPRPSCSHDEIVLVAYNIALIGAAEVVAALSLYRRQCEMEKDQLEQRWALGIQKGVEHGALDAAQAPKWTGVRAAYEFAIMTREARIRWCDTVLGRSEAVVGLSMGRA